MGRPGGGGWDQAVRLLIIFWVGGVFFAPFFLRLVVFYIHLVYFSFFKAGFCCFSLLFSDCVSKMWSVFFIEIDK